jgi:peptidoglycan/LPS O-acetylase OafA/YrhL
VSFAAALGGAMSSDGWPTNGRARGPVPSRSRGRRLDIQGLRAVAVGMVLAFHSGLPLPGGFVGVDIFFVI